MKKLCGLIIALCGFAFVAQIAQPVSAQVLTPNNAFVDAVGGTKSVENVNVIGDNQGQQDALINVIKGWINWILGILALIALIFVMYGGFLMVTAAGDEDKYKKGFTILRQAAVGLILIGVAWFIISLIFWLINLAGDGAVDQSAGTGN